MRKVVNLALLLFCITATSLSQPLVHYGLKIGPSLASLTWEVGGSPNNGIRNRFGFDAGGFIEWLDSPVFTIVSELHYVQKGMKEEMPLTTEQYPNGTGEFMSQDIRLDYISFGVLPKVRIETSDLELYIVAGPRVDFALSHSVDVKGREPLRTYSARGYESLVKRFKSTQFGGTVGVGVQAKSIFPFSTGIEVRYSPNLQSAFSDDSWNIRTTSFEFLLTLCK